MPALRAGRNRNQSLTLISTWHEIRFVHFRIAREARLYRFGTASLTSWDMKDLMRSRTTMELFRYWNTVRGDRDLPRRDEIAPAEIRSLLPELFILQRQADGAIRFRLAGTRLCTMFGGELRDQQFAVLWQQAEKAEITRIAERVMTQCAPVLISACGETAVGETLDLELLLTPLASADGHNDRVLAVLSPLSCPPWLHMTPIARLVASGLRILDPNRDIPLDDVQVTPTATSVCIVDGRGNTVVRTLHLRVLEGGRHA